VSARPLPAPSELTAGFWEAARRRTLVRPVCGRCGRSFFSPQIACPDCLSEDWSYEPSSGRGVVYSATIVHRAPYPGFEAPYELAMIDLDEGWTMLANIVATDGAPTPIGTPVAVDWLEAGDILLPVFRRGAA
jgi:uncharacterized OB-fold protein